MNSTTTRYKVGPGYESQPIAAARDPHASDTSYGTARVALAKVLEQPHPADEPTCGQLLSGIGLFGLAIAATALIEGLL